MDWHIERIDTCESTQDEAHARAQDGAPHGTVVFTGTMADGRGQHGRGWHAPQGGVYLSMVLRDVPAPKFLTLALGNAVADVLGVAGAEPRLKWVNDVWVDGKKIAGILVEAETTGDQTVYIAGLGINVNGHAADWPHPLNGTATTLEDVLGAEACIEDLEAFLLESITGWLQKLDGRTEEVIAAWQARDALEGQTVGFDPDGDFCTKLVGTAAGIDAEGRLRLVTDEGEQVFDNGSVFLQESRQTS